MVLSRRRESLGEYSTPLDTDPSYDGVTERFGKMPETYELVRTDDHSSLHVPDYQVQYYLDKELPEGNKFLMRKDYDEMVNGHNPIATSRDDMAPQLNFGSAESIADEMEIDPIAQDALMRIAKGLQIANTGLAAAADAYNDLRARMYQGVVQ